MYNQKNNTKNGFTLAETLMTLMIIGVIAAMTIPTLKRSAGEQETVAGMKKAYSTLCQVVMLSENDNGPLARWNMNDETKFFQTYLLPYYNVIKDCGADSNCFGPPIYHPNGTSVYGNHANSYKAILADGTRLTTAAQGAHTHVHIDLNGSKPPNSLGADVFMFTVTKAGFTDYGHNVSDGGVYYFGQGLTREAALTECKSTGYTCGALIMMDGGKIKYY